VNGSYFFSSQAKKIGGSQVVYINHKTNFRNVGANKNEFEENFVKIPKKTVRFSLIPRLIYIKPFSSVPETKV